MPVIWFQNLYLAQIGCLSATPSKTKNRNAVFIERVIYFEERDLFILHSPNEYLFGVSSFVFSPILSLHQGSGRWEGVQLFTEIFACQTTSALAVPTLAQITSPTRLSAEWLWAGELLMPFLLAAGSFPAHATEFLPDPCHILARPGEQSSAEVP